MAARKNNALSSDRASEESVFPEPAALNNLLASCSLFFGSQAQTVTDDLRRPSGPLVARAFRSQSKEQNVLAVVDDVRRWARRVAHVEGARRRLHSHGAPDPRHLGSCHRQKRRPGERAISLVARHIMSAKHIICSPACLGSPARPRAPSLSRRTPDQALLRPPRPPQGGPSRAVPHHGDGHDRQVGEE